MSEIDLSFLDSENRRKDCKEFFGWESDELIDALFKHSCNYYEGPWKIVEHDADLIQLYYAAGLYSVRQLSYTITSGNLSMRQGELTKIWLDEIIKDGGSVLEIGAGAMDTGLYLAKHGIEYTALEHWGVPEQLCLFRKKKYNCENITVINEKSELSEADHTICLSVLDHIYDPIQFVREKLVPKTKKCIWARPNIDENYDRPAHDKAILKDVPEAFEIINEFNKKNGFEMANKR